MATPLVSEVLIRIREMLNETATIGGQWTQTQLRRLMNDGLGDIARVTNFLRDRLVITLTANVAEYSVAENVLTIDSAYYLPGDGRYIPLQARQWESMDVVWGQRQNQNSGGYPFLFTVWGFSPNLKIRFYPVPPTTSHTVSLMITRTPAKIDVAGSTDSSSIDFPEAWIDAIVAYVEYRALRADRDPRWQEAKGEYSEIRDTLMVMGDYLTVDRELIMDPYTGAGGVPGWLADFD